MKNIRNFCIIAHIDHGKSTLADRLLEYTNTVAAKDMEAQVLDDMDLERERGITIKSHAIQMAIDNDLEIIPVLNKCDLDSANPDEVEDQIVDLLGCDRSEIIRASGKTGMGVPEILRAIAERIPAPQVDPDAPLQALIFDSVFNSVCSNSTCCPATPCRPAMSVISFRASRHRRK